MLNARNLNASKLQDQFECEFFGHGVKRISFSKNTADQGRTVLIQFASKPDTGQY
jgi:hypothetical protein